MAAGFTSLARMIAFIGVAGNTGLAVENIIKHPEVAPIAIMGALMGAKLRTPPEFTDAAKATKAMKGTDLRSKIRWSRALSVRAERYSSAGLLRRAGRVKEAGGLDSCKTETAGQKWNAATNALHSIISCWLKSYVIQVLCWFSRFCSPCPGLNIRRYPHFTGYMAVPTGELRPNCSL